VLFSCFLADLLFTNSIFIWALPWLKRLVAGLSPRRPGFAPGSIHVGFVVDKVALGRFSPSTSVSPANIYHSTIAPYSSITAPWGVRLLWPSSTLSHPRSSVRGFTSEPAHWLETEIESKKKAQLLCLSVVYLTTLFSNTASNERVISEWWIGKDLKGIDSDLI
jgi:hypothetical protein